MYLIDGTQYDANAIAEYFSFPFLRHRNLYDLFVNPTFVAHPCPLLLAVNKSDLPSCADNQVVFEKLENELLVSTTLLTRRDIIKESRGSVEAVGESNTNQLGVEGQKFSFEKDAPCDVFACNCSVKDQKTEKITGFISSVLH